MQSNTLNLPAFTLSPENIFHKVAGFFGYQDIDFQSPIEFSRAYLLRGKDVSAVRNTFTDSILRYFTENKGLTLEGKGDIILYYRHGRLVKPEALRSFLVEGMNVFQLFTVHSS
jgi:hypothetical protein